MTTTTTERVLAPSSQRSLPRLVWRLETPVGLVAMFTVAFFIRVLIAPHFGFYGDLRLFKMWAARLDDVGPHRFYVQGQFADYPPGYLYVLWLLGKLSAAPGYVLLKLPPILADLSLGWIAGTFAARLAPSQMKGRLPVRALAAAAVLFNPAVIALSTVWGQVDSVPALFVLSSLLLLFTGPPSLRGELVAFVLFAVAIAMKPQSGFVLPIMIYALYRRHLRGRPRPELLEGVLRVAAPLVVALDVWSLSGIPFGLGPAKLYRFYSHSASVYPVTSANAFNLWGVVGFWRNDSTGNHVLTIAGVSALHVGMLAFIVGVVLVLWRLHRALEQGADQARALTVAAATVSLLAFVLLTRMHERYMFLSLACLAPLVVLRPIRLVYAGLSGLFVLNLWYPYAYFNSQWKVQDLRFDPLFDWVLGGFATDTWQKKLWSLAITGIALLLAWRGLSWAKAAEPATERAPADAVPRGRPALARVAPRAHVIPRAIATTWPRWMPAALVGLACLFSLVVLRGETSPAPNLNDSAFHLQMVRWADGQIREGRVPFDGWYPYLSLGSAQFHHYQSLPHTLTAYAARTTGASDEHTYLWILYLLLALWPIAVYWGARLLGWGRWTAAASAAISPLVVSASGYGYEHGSYTWRGYGVYSQLWGMWLLPLAWGLTWRAVSRGRHFAAAATALAFTIACHFITGYLALLTVGVWVVVVGAGPARRRHEVDIAKRVLQEHVLQRLVRSREGAGLALHGPPLRRRSFSRRHVAHLHRRGALHHARTQGSTSPRASRRLRPVPAPLLRPSDSRTRSRPAPRLRRRSDPPLRHGRPPRRDLSRRRWPCMAHGYGLSGPPQPRASPAGCVKGGRGCSSRGRRPCTGVDRPSSLRSERRCPNPCAARSRRDRRARPGQARRDRQVAGRRTRLRRAEGQLGSRLQGRIRAGVRVARRPRRRRDRFHVPHDRLAFDRRRGGLR
jgi:Gpi18-like mannosyltransferase